MGMEVEAWVKLKVFMNEIKGAGKLLEQEPCFGGDIDIHKGAWILCDGAFEPASGRGGWGVVYALNGVIEAVKAGWLDRVGSCFEAECIAFHEGCKLAAQRELGKVCIASDSVEALRAICLGSWRPEVRLRDIKETFIFLGRHLGWSTMCIAREKNRSADWLAKRARSGMWEWSSSSSIPKDLPGLL
ncbi:hypothetical protein QQ045_005754 [Rhodiola kirilowii]